MDAFVLDVVRKPHVGDRFVTVLIPLSRGYRVPGDLLSVGIVEIWTRAPDAWLDAAEFAVYEKRPTADTPLSQAGAVGGTSPPRHYTDPPVWSYQCQRKPLAPFRRGRPR